MGRVLINFKMTDYASSYSSAKMVRNEEEAQKFDMIRKFLAPSEEMSRSILHEI